MFARRAVLTGHEWFPATLRVDRSGQTLVSTAADNTVRVWDCATWTIRHVITDMDEGARPPIMICDLAPDGRYLVTGVPDLTAKVYSTETGQRLTRLPPLAKKQFASEFIRFSPAGDLLACAQGKKIELYAVDSFDLVGVLQGHTSKVHLLEFSPDGRTLISCGGKQVKLWDVAAQAERTTLAAAKLLGSLAVCANGESFATGGEDHKVCLWSLPEGKLCGESRWHQGQVFGLAVAPDGRTLASWGMENSLILWKAEGCEPIARLKDVSGRPVFLPAIPPGQNALLFAGKPEALILDLTGQVIQRLPAENGERAVASDGSWFAVVEGKTIAIWARK